MCGAGVCNTYPHLFMNRTSRQKQSDEDDGKAYRMDVTAVTSMRYVTKQKGATRGALCGRERFPPAADDASSDNADRSVATKLAGPFAEDPDPEPDPSVVGVPSKGLRGPAGGIFEQTVHALKDFPSQCAIHSLLLIIRMIRTFASHFK